MNRAANRQSTSPGDTDFLQKNTAWETIERQDETEAPGLLRRHGPALAAGAAAVLLIAGGVFLVMSTNAAPPTKPAQEFEFVQVIPPPPPPPPPPEEQPQEPEPEPEEEMIEQPEVTETDVKEEAEAEEPEEAPPAEADEPPPGPLGLDAEAEGPGDSFNLAGRPGGRGILSGGGGGGSRWGWYASIVQQQIEAALRANPKTRSVVMQIQVRLWADSSGRVTRVQLVSSTGNPEVDAAIRGEALAGIRLREPPPSDMPMPLVARVTARRPG